MHATRRQFLKATLGSSALISLAPFAPQFLRAAAAQQSKSKGEKILVVVQLTGGNDGLNTVIPYADDVYHSNRLTLGIKPEAVLKIDDHFGFHPSMGGFSKLLESGRLSVVQGVGYANPNRSHFDSMDIWHTARRKMESRPTGWLGRALDAHAKRDGRDLPGLRLGSGNLPLALSALDVRVPSVQSLDEFRLVDGGDKQLRSAIEASTSAARPADDDLLKFVQSSTAAALASSKRMQEALGRYKTDVKYPESDLAKNLNVVAQLIDAGLGTRMYYMELDGFDTHSDQAQAHTALLGQLSAAVSAFDKDISAHGHGDRVAVLSFSEFGRRVKENASRGTDHGAAAPMFLAGGGLRPGLIGKHPSLTDLDDGDQKFHTDFRQVYAAALENWLGWKSEAILGESFKPVSVFAERLANGVLWQRRHSDLRAEIVEVTRAFLSALPCLCDDDIVCHWIVFWWWI